MADIPNYTDTSRVIQISEVVVGKDGSLPLSAGIFGRLPATFWQSRMRVTPS